MKAIRAYFRMVMFILTISFYISWCILNKLIYSDFLSRNKKVRSRWIKLVNRILGFEAEVTGELQEGTFLVIANHRSFSDPLIMLEFIDAFPLAKAEVDSYPFVGFGARITGILYVTRDSLKSRKGARHSIKETLKAGQNVLVYPEGTTSTDAGTIPFRRGSFQIANELGLQIQPVSIEYEHVDHHWGEQSLWRQYLLQFGERKCRCKLHFGPLMSADSDSYGSAEVRREIDNTILVMRGSYDKAVKNQSVYG